MREDQVHLLIRDVDPLADIRWRDADLEAGESELLAELVTTEVPLAAPERDAAAKPTRSRVLRFGFAAGLAAVIAMGIVLALGHRDDESGSAYAAEAVRVAEANRRLLVTEPGWHVYSADFESPSYGEVNFEDQRGIFHGGDYLDMVWYGTEREIAQRSRPGGRPVTVAGEPAYFYEESRGSYVAVLHGDIAHDRQPGEPGAQLELGQTSMLIKGTAPSADAFRGMLRSIVSVDVDTWLGAMPPSVVQPDSADARLEEILRGVPLPPGFNPESVKPAGMPQDSYQFDAYVLSGAYCGWLDEWWRAKQAGDQAAADAAVHELLDSPDWPAVRALADTGALDQDFRMYAHTVAEGQGDKQVYDQMMNCVEYP